MVDNRWALVLSGREWSVVGIESVVLESLSLYSSTYSYCTSSSLPLVPGRCQLASFGNQGCLPTPCYTTQNQWGPAISQEILLDVLQALFSTIESAWSKLTKQNGDMFFVLFVFVFGFLFSFCLFVFCLFVFWVGVGGGGGSLAKGSNWHEWHFFQKSNNVSAISTSTDVNGISRWFK